MENIDHPFGLTVFNDYIYWTDWHTKNVEGAHKDGGNNRHVIASDLENLMDIHAFHRNRAASKFPVVSNI